RDAGCPAVLLLGGGDGSRRHCSAGLSIELGGEPREEAHKGQVLICRVWIENWLSRDAVLGGISHSRFSLVMRDFFVVNRCFRVYRGVLHASSGPNCGPRRRRVRARRPAGLP